MKPCAVLRLCLLATFLLTAGTAAQAAERKPGIVGYVTSWSDDMPDPHLLTCINYAFGHVNDTFNGITIDNEERLRKILELKKQAPGLKVVLSIGGWKSGGFSEMASDARRRRTFAWNCRQLIWDMGLDGIDIDWEYPTNSDSGIASSPKDTENFTLLMRDIRTAIGPKRILSFASVSSADYIDYLHVMEYVDYVNVMTYDMGVPPYHNSPLYQSGYVQNISVSQSISYHINMGVPRGKIMLGIPFYGHGVESFPQSVKIGEARLVDNFFYNWDDEAKVPYLTDREGNFSYSFEDVRSVILKCNYVMDERLGGVMLWTTDGDDEKSTLLKTVNNTFHPAD